MKILPSGHFSYVIDGPTLSKGLRANNANGRNSYALIQSVGAIGKDGTLQSLPTIALSDLLEDPLVIAEDFPFPQIFTLDKHLIVCNRDSILEWNYDQLVLKISVEAGELWEVASIDNFIYLSNGEVSVVRDPNTGSYALTTDAPVCSAICNFNGQIICGNLK